MSDKAAEYCFEYIESPHVRRYIMFSIRTTADWFAISYWAELIHYVRCVVNCINPVLVILRTNSSLSCVNLTTEHCTHISVRVNNNSLYSVA